MANLNKKFFANWGDRTMILTVVLCIIWPVAGVIRTVWDNAFWASVSRVCGFLLPLCLGIALVCWVISLVASDDEGAAESRPKQLLRLSFGLALTTIGAELCKWLLQLLAYALREGGFFRSFCEIFASCLGKLVLPCFLAAVAALVVAFMVMPSEKRATLFAGPRPVKKPQKTSASDEEDLFDAPKDESSIPPKAEASCPARTEEDDDELADFFASVRKRSV